MLMKDTIALATGATSGFVTGAYVPVSGGGLIL